MATDDGNSFSVGIAIILFLWYRFHWEHLDHKQFEKVLNTFVLWEEQTAMLCVGGRHAPNWRPFPERNEVTDFIKFHIIIIRIRFTCFTNWINKPCIKNGSVNISRSKVFSVFGKKLGQRYSARSQCKEFSVVWNKVTDERNHPIKDLLAPSHMWWGYLSWMLQRFVINWNRGDKGAPTK